MEVLVAIVVALIPGALIGYATGLRTPWALVSAVPVTYGVVGLAAWLFGAIHVGFTPATVGLFTLIIAALGLGWRWLWRNERRYEQREETQSTRDVRWALPAVGVVVGSGMIIRSGIEWIKQSPHGLNNIVQGWDSQWHANTTRFIMDTHMASPTRMGELLNLENHAQSYYPSAFHALAALIGDVGGMEPIVAVNVASVVLPGLTLPATLAMLAWKLVGGRSLTAQIAGALAGAAGLLTPVMFWIPQYVGMWPYLAAVAMTGIVAGLFMSAVYSRTMIMAAALALAGMMQVHPASVTYVVFIVALWWLTSLLVTPVRTRLKDLAVLASAGVVGAVIVLPQVLAGSGSASEVAGFTAEEDLSRTQAWVHAITMNTRHVREFFPDYSPLALLIVAAFGMAALFFWRRQVWGVAFWFLSVLLTVHSLRPFASAPVLDALISLHYSTGHRLIMPVAMMTVAFAAAGLAVAIRLLTGGPVTVLRAGRGVKYLTTSASLLVALITVCGVATYSWMSTAPGAKQAFTAARSDQRMVSDADLRAWDWLSHQPKAYEGLIFNNADEGTGWMYAYAGLPSLNRHYRWPDVTSDSATSQVKWHGYLAGAGMLGDREAKNISDDNLEKLGVNYVVLSPWPFWNYLWPHWSLLYGMEASDGITPVYREGRVAIYAVTRNFSPEQLNTMRAQSPDPLPAR